MTRVSPRSKGKIPRVASDWFAHLITGRMGLTGMERASAEAGRKNRFSKCGPGAIASASPESLLGI